MPPTSVIIMSLISVLTMGLCCGKPDPEVVEQSKGVSRNKPLGGGNNEQMPGKKNEPLSTSLIIEKQADCNVLSAHIKSDNFPRHYRNSIDSLRQRYSLVKAFSGGKGGAYVALVRDIQDNGIEKIVKIFPSINIESNKYNYRELFYTCLNSFISYKDLGIIIDRSPQSTNAFPRLLELGVTNAAALDSPGREMVYPYMVIEFIKGESLTDLGVRANANKGNVAYTQNKEYNLYNINQKQAIQNNTSSINKQKTQEVLYQIIQILYKLKRINVNGKEYGFFQADLNPGNIMLRKAGFSGSLDAGYGPIRVKNLPLVTLIDFGHSTSNLDDDLGSKVTSLKTIFHQRLHFMSESANKFYRNLNDKALGTIAEVLIAAQGYDSDIRLYKVIARAIFDSKNYTDKALMVHLNTCNTRIQCVEKAPLLFRTP